MDISGHDWKDLILFCLSFMFGSVLVGGLEVIKMFIQSKPPGRRLVRDLQLCRLTVCAAGSLCLLQVTADIHVYQAASLQGLFGMFCLAHMIKAVFKSVSFWATFTIVWLIIFPLGKTF